MRNRIEFAPDIFNPANPACWMLDVGFEGCVSRMLIID